MSDEKRNLPVKWADEAMYESEEIIFTDYPRVFLASATPDPLGAIAAFCMMYEGRIVDDLEDVTNKERVHYWKQANSTHLKAPLETVDLHFFLEGVTRSFTHQMVRQRTAVYAQESLRFAVKPDLRKAVRPGPSIKGDKFRQSIYYKAIEEVQKAYLALIEDGVPQEDARGLLPHDTLTRLHYKTNLRNLMDHIGNRLCTQAQFEWRYVGAGIREAIRKREPENWQWELIADSAGFAPVCYALGHCPFTATFDRHCEIRDRVQAGEFDKIKTEEWLADPTAARKS